MLYLKGIVQDKVNNEQGILYCDSVLPLRYSKYLFAILPPWKSCGERNGS